MKMFHTKLMLQAYDYYTLTIATMPVKPTHNYGYMNHIWPQRTTTLDILWDVLYMK